MRMRVSPPSSSPYAHRLCIALLRSGGGGGGGGGGALDFRAKQLAQLEQRRAEKEREEEQVGVHAARWRTADNARAAKKPGRHPVGVQHTTNAAGQLERDEMLHGTVRCNVQARPRSLQPEAARRNGLADWSIFFHAAAADRRATAPGSRRQQRRVAAPSSAARRRRGARGPPRT